MLIFYADMINYVDLLNWCIKELIFYPTCCIMEAMHNKKEELELSQIEMPLAAFLASYNESIPSGFPRASVATLKKFQAGHPTLFKHGDSWLIAQHRKRLIDWLLTHRDIS